MIHLEEERIYPLPAITTKPLNILAEKYWVQRKKRNGMGIYCNVALVVRIGEIEDMNIWRMWV